MLNKTKQNWLIDCSVLFGFVQYCTSQCPLLLRMRLRRCLSCFAIDAVAFPAMFGSIKSSGCPLFFGNQPASLPKQQLQVGRRRRRRRRRRPPLGHWGGLQRQPACSDSQCPQQRRRPRGQWLRVDPPTGRRNCRRWLCRCVRIPKLPRPLRGRSSRKKFVACMAGTSTFDSGARLRPEWRAPTSTVIPAPSRSFQMRDLCVVENLLCETGASLESS